MSPHAVRSETPQPKSDLDMRKFGVTRNAFLPQDKPCQRLPDPYYEPWELVAQRLPELIDGGGIRDAVGKLPVLSTERLTTEPEWRRAYSMLAFMTHAYIWGGDKPEEILPPQLTVPFLRVSDHLELPPVLTYAGANLWNFTCAGDDFTKLEDLDTLFSFTGTESESWFLLVSVAMEARAASIISTLADALEAVKTRDYEVITRALIDLTETIQGIGTLLERMYEKCDPMTFYHHIRPFLAGSKNMEAAGLTRGVFYDEGDGRGEWRQLRGGSNGQSSLIQFFDVALGVDHGTHGSAGQKSYHDEVREYMPGPHRRFLVHAARAGSIRELAAVSGSGIDEDDSSNSSSEEDEKEEGLAADEKRRLREAYKAATAALTHFRNKHIQIVTRYIILPSKQPWTGSKRQNLARSSSAEVKEGSGGKQSGGGRQEELKGTGGTALVPFLKQARDDTTNAGDLTR